MRVLCGHPAGRAAAALAAIIFTAAQARAQSAALVPPSDPGRVPVRTSTGEFRRHWFEQRSWFEPLVADPRGAQIAMDGLALGRPFPFSVTSGSRMVWDVSLGKELPIVLREKNTDGDHPIPPGAWGFGFWLPVSFHTVGDLREPFKPIVNTDYRFGVAFKVAHGLRHHPNDRLAFNLHVGHESSHVGDEFLLSALKEYGDAFARIDVTYEFVEAGFSWDRVLGAHQTHQVTLRAGGLHAVDYVGQPGFYTAVTSSGRPITLSRRHFEPGFGFEYFYSGSRQVGFFASLDVRDRTVYDYERATRDEDEHSEWSYSVVWGLRPLQNPRRGKPELVARAYYGVNPNGQFRSQPRYWLVGFGLHVRV
jgi:hypothetical protein